MTSMISVVYMDKACTKLKMGGPKFGDVGYVKDGVNGTVSQVYYDKGGQQRAERQCGGAISTNAPGWVSLEEFRNRKAARSRMWKLSYEGQQAFLAARKKISFLLEHGRSAMGELAVAAG